MAHDDDDDDGDDEVNVWYRLAFGRMDGGMRGFSFSRDDGTSRHRFDIFNPP